MKYWNTNLSLSSGESHDVMLVANTNCWEISIYNLHIIWYIFTLKLIIPVPSLSNNLKIWFAKSLALCLGIAYISSMFSLFITPSGQTAMNPLQLTTVKQPHYIQTMEGWIYMQTKCLNDKNNAFIITFSSWLGCTSFIDSMT